MTRKDYVLIAQAISKARADNAQRQVASLEYLGDVEEGIELGAQAIADALQADNPRFDRARFLVACGVTR